MIWYAWAMIGLICVNSIGNILLIHKPREPLQSHEVLIILIMNFLYGWGVVELAT